MSTLQVDNRIYFPNTPWILNQQGAIIPQPLDVSPWVPADATAYAIQCALFRASLPPGNPAGYIDAATVIRLPGHLTTDYTVAALLVGQLQSGGQLEGGGFGHIVIPNMELESGGRGFYWHIAGTTLQFGTNVSFSLPWYELP